MVLRSWNEITWVHGDCVTEWKVVPISHRKTNPSYFYMQHNFTCTAVDLISFSGRESNPLTFLPGFRRFLAHFHCVGNNNTKRIISITISMLLIITPTIYWALPRKKTCQTCMQKTCMPNRSACTCIYTPNKVECMRFSPKNPDDSNLFPPKKHLEANPLLTDSPAAWNIAQIFSNECLRKIRSPYSASAEELFW